MSMVQRAADLVDKLGESTADDLLVHLPDASRAQVFAALRNAVTAGRLEVVGHQTRPKSGGATRVAVYATATHDLGPRDRRPPRPYKRVASVWELARA